jgi:hypothetical protein
MHGRRVFAFSEFFFDLTGRFSGQRRRSYLRSSVFIDNPFMGAHYLAISVLNPVKLTEIEIRAVEAHGRLYVQI